MTSKTELKTEKKEFDYQKMCRDLLYVMENELTKEQEDYILLRDDE